MKFYQIIFLTIIFTIFFIPASEAQTERQYTIGKIYPGYYVTLENDTIHGYIKNGNVVFNQKNCHFYINETDKKPTHKFKTDQILAYRVSDRIYRSINYSGGLFKKPLRFNLVTNDGAITEYVFYSEDAAREERIVFHKANDPDNADPVEFTSFGFGFARKMSEYVADYPELAEKVSNKESGYRMLRIMEIIEEYNEWYLNKE